MQNTITEVEAFNQLVAGTMSDDEFVVYANEFPFGEGVEALYEQISEAQNEICMFGDSGPGTGIHIRESIASWNKVADALSRITGQVIRNRPRPPVHNYAPMHEDDFGIRSF